MTVIESDTLLHDIRDMKWSNGRLWVLSRYEPHVGVFTGSGEASMAFGAKGDGPGEFGTPWSLVSATEPDSVDMYVWDAGDRRLEGYTASGEFVTGVQLDVSYGPVIASFESSYYGEPLRVRRVGSDLVLSSSPGQTTRSGSLWASTLTLLRSSMEPLLVATFEDFLPDDQAEIAWALGPVPLWTVCGGESLALFNPFTQEVHLVSAAGSPIRSLAAVVPQEPISETDVRRWAQMALELEAREIGIDPEPEQVRQAVESAVSDLVEQVPKASSPVAMRCDPSGQIWLQGFSTDTDPRGYDSTWYGVEPHQVVEFPAGFRPLDFQADRVYGVFTDAFDVQTIAWVERVGW